MSTGDRGRRRIGRRLVKIFAWTGVLALATSTFDAYSQHSYPGKPIRVVVPFAAGGSTDYLARAIGQHLHAAWGQQVVVDNRPGAGGIVGSEIVASATPDGYTLLMNAIGHVANPSLYKKLPYDTLRDFSPITAVADVPMFLVVNPKVKAQTVQELIALARANPGGINVGAGGIGSSHFLAGELFRVGAHIKWEYLQYRGAAPVLVALLAGEVDLTFTPVSNALPHVKAGRLRALGVTSPHRVPFMPGVPTIAESGIPGYDARAWYGIVAPARVPKDILEKLNHEINRVLRDEQFRNGMMLRGAVPMGGSTQDFDWFIRAEVRKYATLVKEAKIARQ